MATNCQNKESSQARAILKANPFGPAVGEILEHGGKEFAKFQFPFE